MVCPFLLRMTCNVSILTWVCCAADIYNSLLLADTYNSPAINSLRSTPGVEMMMSIGRLTGHASRACMQLIYKLMIRNKIKIK